MAERWANVQDQSLADADLPGLRQYSGVLLIAAWPDATAQTLARLDRAGCPVKMFRFVQDPRGWPGWPGDFIRRCPWAVLANEPDLEKWPAWYAAVCEAWAYAGGKLVEPAWHDDEARTSAPSGVHHHAVSWHCYAGQWTNRAAVLARAGSLPVFGTEYGRPHAQQQCLIDLAAAGVTEPTALFAYPTWLGNSAAGYDLRGVALLPPPPPKGPTMRGIDVSNAQGAPNWPAVAASGVGFVAVKASEGVGWPSPTFAAQWAGAGAAGLTRIAYHFARCDLAGNAPDAEAAYFVGLVAPVLQPGDLVALDIEVGGGDLSAWALAWLAHVTDALGFRPLCYSYPSFIFASLRDPALTAYPLWYASYQAQEPPAPAPWSQIAIWQDDDAASVPGVGGLVDADVTWLSAADLRGLGKPAPDPAPTPQEVDDVLTITPAITAAARDRYSALGIQPFEGGAIWKEFLARYAVGQANPSHNSILPPPALTPEVTPDASGDAYAMFDDGSIWVWRKAKGQVFTLEEKDRAAARALCGWAARFS